MTRLLHCCLMLWVMTSQGLIGDCHVIHRRGISDNQINATTTELPKISSTTTSAVTISGSRAVHNNTTKVEEVVASKMAEKLDDKSHKDAMTDYEEGVAHDDNETDANEFKDPIVVATTEYPRFDLDRYLTMPLIA